MESHRQPTRRREVHDDSARLCGAHHRAQVVLGENAFERNHRWSMLVEDSLDTDPDRVNASFDGRIDVRPDHAVVDEAGGAIGVDVDDTESATRQTGGHAENAHRHVSSVLVLELRQHIGGDIDIGEHVLHVVAVLEGVDKTEDLASRVGVGLDGDAGNELGFG